MYFNTPLGNFIKLEDTDFSLSSSSKYNNLKVLLTTMILKCYNKNIWGSLF